MGDRVAREVGENQARVGSWGPSAAGTARRRMAAMLLPLTVTARQDTEVGTAQVPGGDGGPL